MLINNEKFDVKTRLCGNSLFEADYFSRLLGV